MAEGSERCCEDIHKEKCIFIPNCKSAWNASWQLWFSTIFISNECRTHKNVYYLKLILLRALHFNSTSNKRNVSQLKISFSISWQITSSVVFYYSSPVFIIYCIRLESQRWPWVIISINTFEIKLLLEFFSIEFSFCSYKVE